MAIALYHLCRDVGTVDAKFLAYIVLYEGWYVGKVAHCSRDFAHFHTLCCLFESLDVALHLGVP